MNRIELNVVTGEQTTIQLTPEEEAAASTSTTLETMVKNTPEALRVVEDEIQHDVAKGDAAILALINQTRAEWAAWAQSSTTGFPSLTVAERTRMGMICWLLAVAIRRLMR